jgi:leucyl-tRNA synthetase
LYKYKEQKPNRKVMQQCMETLALLLAPFTPHIAEEVWEMLGKKGFVSLEGWPKADEKLIDPKLELGEKIVNSTLEDIRQIIRIVGKKPEKIMIYVSPLWKYTAYETILKSVKKPGNIVQEMMKNPEIRSQGKHAVHFAERLRKDMDRLGEILSQEEEYSVLKEFEEQFGKEFDCEVKVLKAEGSRSEKALRAEPGKPGIEIL